MPVLRQAAARCKQFKRPSADTLFRLQANAKKLRLLFAMLFLSA